MTIEELEAKLEIATKHRDALEKMLDETNGHVRDLAALVEPGLNRHPITVIQAAQAFIRTLVEQRDEARDTIVALTTAGAEKDLEIATLTRERDEARAEAKELREVLTLAGERLKACSYELTEFSYQEMASVLFDLPCNTEEPTNG